MVTVFFLFYKSDALNLSIITLLPNARSTIGNLLYYYKYKCFTDLLSRQDRCLLFQYHLIHGIARRHVLTLHCRLLTEGWKLQITKGAETGHFLGILFALRKICKNKRCVSCFWVTVTLTVTLK